MSTTGLSFDFDTNDNSLEDGIYDNSDLDDNDDYNSDDNDDCNSDGNDDYNSDDNDDCNSDDNDDYNSDDNDDCNSDDNDDYNSDDNDDYNSDDNDDCNSVDNDDCNSDDNGDYNSNENEDSNDFTSYDSDAFNDYNFNEDEYSNSFDFDEDDNSYSRVNREIKAFHLARHSILNGSTNSKSSAPFLSDSLKIYLNTPSLIREIRNTGTYCLVIDPVADESERMPLSSPQVYVGKIPNSAKWYDLKNWFIERGCNRPPTILETTGNDSSIPESSEEKRLPGFELIGHANVWLFKLAPDEADDNIKKLFDLLHDNNLSPGNLFKSDIIRSIKNIDFAKKNFEPMTLISNDKWILENQAKIDKFFNHQWSLYPFETKFEVMKLISKHIITVHDLIVDEQVEHILQLCSIDTLVALTDKIFEFALLWCAKTFDNEDEDRSNENESEENQLSINIDDLSIVDDDSFISKNIRLAATGGVINAETASNMTTVTWLGPKKTKNGIILTKLELRTAKNDSLLTRKIYITPSSILYEGPYCEEKCVVTRQYVQYQDRFLRVAFRDEDYRALHNYNDNMAKMYERIKKILKNGINICDRNYQFLAFSSSQLREHSCWMFASPDDRTTVDTIREWIGDFRNVHPVAKLAARQSFSTSMKGIQLENHRINEIPDEKRCTIDANGSHEYCFTDGIGIISLPFAKRLAKAMKLPEQVYPCAFQVRCGGYKEALEGGYLDACDALKKLNNFDENGYHRFLITYLKHLHEQRDPFVRQLTRVIRTFLVKELRRKAKIFVPNSWSLLGVVDETRTLNYGQVFIQIDSGNKQTDESTEIFRGPVVVTRNPCFHPGDFRRLTAVDVPALHKLKNVIVFPMNGPRPHPAEMSGGDLDGDTFWISRHPDLIFKENEDPFDYQDQDDEAIIIQTTNDIQHTIEDVCNFFGEYIAADNLGMIANSHLALSDQIEGGARNEKCLQLAKMHSVAVDFAKKGINAPHLTKELRPPQYPHFMEKNDKIKYRSKSILGQLYDRTQSYDSDIHVNEEEEIKTTSSFPYKSFFIVGDKCYIKDARMIKSEYDRDILRIMRQYGIQYEAEIVSGCLLKFTSKQYAKETKTFDLRNEITHAYKILRDK
ncbi:unnamed protein product [Rotaria sp. Silwood2]|nr:unnamed protein product [Rotaria sp. Silwood2]